jgi:hypothetical protein
VWVEELRKYEEHVTKELKKYYELKGKKWHGVEKN